jgi:PAP2 superfamily
VVLSAGIAGIALAARRSRTVAIVMFVVVAARPPFEWLVKEVVARPRPSGARLVPATGFAYPSGHVLAAAATWGLVPAIAGLYLKRRWVWRSLTAAAWTVIGLIAWCRIWLGVHWTSDVVGGPRHRRGRPLDSPHRHRPKDPPTPDLPDDSDVDAPPRLGAARGPIAATSCSAWQT